MDLPGASHHQLLRYRVDRLEEAVGDIQSAINLMDTSLRPLSIALLKIKGALSAIVVAADEYEPE